MSSAEIIAELPRLSAAELAHVQAKLLELLEPCHAVPRTARMNTPRLVHPEQSKDFVKTIVELIPD